MVTTQKEAAGYLIEAALRAGCTVSVYDGEAWPIRKSTNGAAIKAELGQTDMETVLVERGGAEHYTAGKFLLVWEHGADALEVICDHTDNRLCNALYSETKAALGR